MQNATVSLMRDEEHDLELFSLEMVSEMGYGWPSESESGNGYESEIDDVESTLVKHDARHVVNENGYVHDHRRRHRLRIQMKCPREHECRRFLPHEI